MAQQSRAQFAALFYFLLEEKLGKLRQKEGDARSLPTWRREVSLYILGLVAWQICWPEHECSGGGTGTEARR